MAGTACAAIGTGLAANFINDACWNVVVQEVRPAICLSKAVRDMHPDSQSLRNAYSERSAQREEFVLPEEVSQWLEDASVAIEKLNGINSAYDRYMQQHESCLGCRPYGCSSRWTIIKDIKQQRRDIDRLLRLHTNLPSPRILIKPPLYFQIPERGFFGKPINSAKTKLEQWLTVDTNVRVIGVCGMGGIGKTSLLHTINQSGRVRTNFKLIIWVEVPNCDMTVSDRYNSQMQDRIAYFLNLKLPDISDIYGRERRQSQLSLHLKKQKFLLLFDDMREKLDLQTLGVPVEHENCKIVLATRSEQLLNTMRVKERIRLETLTEDEAWMLFREVAFQDGNVPSLIEEDAREIARRCDGLPLAVKVVAAEMANYVFPDVFPEDWKGALRKMQMGKYPEIDTQLFRCFQWSYDALSEDLKACFIYFAAYPEQTVIDVDEVVEVWTGEGLVEATRDSYLYETGHTLIRKLKDRCLIEVVKTNIVGRIEQFKIHNTLRDFLGFRIAEKDYKCIFKAGQRGQSGSEFPSAEDSEGAERMSLMHTSLCSSSLPTTFACSSLLVLLLKQNPEIEEIPKDFLLHFFSLKVLDLSYTGISSLPTCIENLENLASIRLCKCEGISKLPDNIGKLKKLKVLNVDGCVKLERLPDSIGELEDLRTLDISGCKMLGHLPLGVSKLGSLERLRMKESIPLKFEEINAGRTQACLKDLKSLCSLRNFSVRIESPIKQGVIVNWSQMKDLYLDFNNVSQPALPRDMPSMKYLERLWLYQCSVVELPGRVMNFNCLTYLKLIDCNQLTSLPLKLQTLPRLKKLSIKGCQELKELKLETGFKYLEKLCLKSLKSLERVQAGPSGESEIKTKLKSFRVEDCEKLKTLTSGWAPSLESLNEIIGQREWWDAVELEDPNMKDSLIIKFRCL